MAKNRLRQLNDHELSSFCRQMALLLKAGIAPASCIDILKQDVTDKMGAKVLDDISNVLLSGEKLQVAISLSGVFPDYVTHMISIGEESGSLDTVMDSLADYYEREEGIRDSIKSAVTYPMIMIGMMFIVIIVIITQVLPIFAKVFAQLGTTMNSFSTSLLYLGVTLNRYSAIVVAIMILLAAMFIYFFATSKGRSQFHAIASEFGPTKSLMNHIAVERFASGMVLMLSSGMDTYNSLTLVSKLVENDLVQKQIMHCKSLIEDGESFPEALEKSGIFNKFYSKMVSVGFKSGAMDAAMDNIAKRYKYDTEKKLYEFISIFEPTLVIILSLIVGMILISVILPLMGIMSSIG